jgi:thiopeptide-type bacteriocin biosynthesis protein
MTVAEQSRQRSSSHRAPRAQYAPLDYVVVRAPLLPVRAFHEVACAPADIRLERAQQDARIREALAIGGASLLNAIDRVPSGRQRDRLDASLLRYLIRMSTRPTPYGLFAGVGLAEWGDTTDLQLDDGPRRTRTRVDMGWLMRWIAEIEEQTELRHALRFVANSAAFERAGRICLAGHAANGDAHAVEEVSVRKTDAVQRVLHAAGTPISHAELVDVLMAGAADPRRERIAGLIDTLWRQAFLITELRPPLTIADPAEYVLRVLERTSTGTQAAALLRPLLVEACDFDRCMNGSRERTFRQLLVRSVTIGVDSTTAALQVDSAIALHGGHISRLVANEATRAAELLLRVSALPDGPANLAAYRRAFSKRYGASRAVPLLEVLDPERGLGPLDAVADIGEPVQDPGRAEIRHQTLLDLAGRCAHDRCRSIELTEDTLARLERPRGAGTITADTVELNVFVGATSTMALDAGDFSVVVGPNVGATTAGKGLGRFADLLGERAEAALRRCAGARDEVTTAVDAELVYLPGATRLANVAVRPSIHPFEIVMGAAPGVAYENVIPLGQLALGLEQDRLVVWWSARGVRVRVHAGHMLNTFTAPPVCRLLAEIGQDGVSQLLPFDWGPAERLPFLPRVCSGRVVLRPAQWRILPGDRAAWTTARSRAELAERIAVWRQDWSAPRFVHVGHGDNRLLLDLQCDEHLDELRAAAEASKGARFVIQEALPAPSECWLSGTDGSYVAELVVPIARCEEADRGTPRGARKPSTSAQAAERFEHRVGPVAGTTRLAAPGSEWLYVKLYCPRSSEDDLLAAEIAPMCERFVSEGIADSWFFIRYTDDGSHLRIRLHGESAHLIETALPAICRTAGRLIGDGRCDRIVFDTYDREIERYGGETGLRSAEGVFAADSYAVAGMLDLLVRRALSLDRTALGMISLDRLLAGLGLSERERLQYYERATGARHAVGELYRRRKRELRSLLADERVIAARPGGDALLTLLADRDSAIVPLAARLRRRHAPAGGELPADWCASVAHLHCNRLLGADPHAESALLALLLRTREGLVSTTMSARGARCS